MAGRRAVAELATRRHHQLGRSEGLDVDLRAVNRSPHDTAWRRRADVCRRTPKARMRGVGEENTTSLS